MFCLSVFLPPFLSFFCLFLSFCDWNWRVDVSLWWNIECQVTSLKQVRQNRKRQRKAIKSENSTGYRWTSSASWVDRWLKWLEEWWRQSERSQSPILRTSLSSMKKRRSWQRWVQSLMIINEQKNKSSLNWNGFIFWFLSSFSIPNCPLNALHACPVITGRRGNINLGTRAMLFDPVPAEGGGPLYQRLKPGTASTVRRVCRGKDTVRRHALRRPTAGEGRRSSRRRNQLNHRARKTDENRK